MIKLEKYRTEVIYSSNDRDEIYIFESSMRIFIEGAVFSQKFKDHIWDGYKNFCNVNKSCFPIGMLPEAMAVLKKEDIKYSIVDNVPKYLPSLDFNEKLYEHQKAAIQAFFENFHGIIKVPTRGGKTMLSAEIVRLLRPDFQELKVLFVVDTEMLLLQAIKDYADYWGVPESEIGRIQGDVYDPKMFTVATIQTLQSRTFGGTKRMKKNKEENTKKLTPAELKLKNKQVRFEKTKFLKYYSEVNFLIVDEVHEYSSEGRINLLKKFKNLYMDLSLSASPFKSQDPIGNIDTKMHFGDVIYTVESETLRERGILASDKIFLFDIDHNNNRNIFSDSTYKQLHKAVITHNPFRNQIVLNLITILRRLELKTLVLVTETKHGEYIQSITGDPFVFGGMKMEDRTFYTNEFLKKKGSVMIASDVFKKGITLPEVEVTVNASGGIEQSNITQKRGRNLGVKGDKKKALTMDFVDNYHMHFFQHSLSRLEAYERLVGMNNIIVFDTDDNQMYYDLKEMLINWFEIDEVEKL